MRIAVIHHDAVPLTQAVARSSGSPDGLVARAAARAALESRGGGGAHVVSLSHREGRGAAAVGSRGTRVGVDLERAGIVPRCRERLFASAAERRAPARPVDGTVLWSFLLIRMLGFAVAVAVLLDAALVRLALGPALPVLAGRWSWWPGRLSPRSRPPAPAPTRRPVSPAPRAPAPIRPPASPPPAM